ncbi:hypothetical protein Pint_21322 [Pistacia integerrima]|uniref:Uncharacterized protein n=1 Tax=Pistacia integerrima TaxID=434235 RepID=A0ACC0XCA2_9ROSI|nr:hypothetical protein Pint_21322 [Pistacia integerrima]
MHIYWFIVKSEEIDSPEKNLDFPAKQRKICVKDPTPKELVAVTSVKHLSKDRKKEQILFLQMALDEDPDYINALIVMGQTQLQKGLLAEAIEYLEACSLQVASLTSHQLFISSHPTKVENIDLLIVASQLGRCCLYKTGKTQ